MVKLSVNSRELPRFQYHSKRYLHAPGYPRLDLILQDEISSDSGCQPLLLAAEVVGDEGSIEHLHLHSISLLDQKLYQLCAGRFIVFLQDGQALQHFTFGGYLTIITQPGFLACEITSVAPIIRLHALEYLDMPSLLAAEVQALLAQRHAAWSHNQSGYVLHLVQADPYQLYCACLDHLRRHFGWKALDADNDLARLFLDYLSEEIEILCERGEWPVKPLPVEQLI